MYYGQFIVLIPSFKPSYFAKSLSIFVHQCHLWPCVRIMQMFIKNYEYCCLPFIFFWILTLVLKRKDTDRSMIKQGTSLLCIWLRFLFPICITVEQVYEHNILLNNMKLDNFYMKEISLHHWLHYWLHMESLSIHII